MLTVACFENARDVYIPDIAASEVSIVLDLLHTGAGRREDGRETRQGAGAVADRSEDAAQASVRSQAALDDPADQRDVDVPAAQAQDDFFPLKIGGFRHDGRQGDGSGAFD